MTSSRARGAGQALIWSARSLGAGGRQLLREIILPGALPQIMTGLQVALPVAMIVTIVTEMLMAGQGLGGAMIAASRFAGSPGVFCRHRRDRGRQPVSHQCMTALRRRLLIWHQEAQEPTTV